MGRVRRKIIQALGAAAMGSAIAPMTSTQAHAWYLYLLRFLLRGALPSRTLRNARSATRALAGFKSDWSAGDGYHIVKVSSRELEPMDIDLGQISEISRDLRDLCHEIKPAAIWVDGNQNTFRLTGTNIGDKTVKGRFILTVDSAFSDRRGIYEYGLVELKAREMRRLVFEAPADLHGRVISLGGYIENTDQVQIEPSPRIVMARKAEVSIHDLKNEGKT